MMKMYWNDLTKTLLCYSNREPLSLLWKPGLKVRKKNLAFYRENSSNYFYITYKFHDI